MDDDQQSEAEPQVVHVAREVTAGRQHPDEFDDAFATATVYGQRPSTPGVLVAELEGQGKWTLVFSTLERLAGYAGDCTYFATTGADLLEQLPTGIGVMFDAGDQHRRPIVTNMLPPEQLNAMRDAIEQQHSGDDAGKLGSQADE